MRKLLAERDVFDHRTGQAHDLQSHRRAVERPQRVVLLGREGLHLIDVLFRGVLGIVGGAGAAGDDALDGLLGALDGLGADEAAAVVVLVTRDVGEHILVG